MLKIARFLVLGLAFVALTGWLVHKPFVPHGPQQSSSTLPCDGTPCAEAYSVVRTLTAAYAGPLFQLNNGSTTLDIGQSAGVADMTTWSAFCSGVQSNCKVSKIYAQIQGHSNDLIPVNVNFFATTCATSVNLCAALFKIEVATGLPILDLTSTSPPVQYFISGDASAVGVNAGLTPLSIVYNGQFVAGGVTCCGVFGLAHCYNCGNVEGQDFLVLVTQNDTGSFAINGNCLHTGAANYCFGVEQEQVSDGGLVNPVPANLLGFVDNDFQNFCTSANYNGHHLYTNCPPASQVPPSFVINPGKSIRLGGGGDISKEVGIWREGYFYNLVLSPNQRATIFANTTAFFSGLSYP